MLKHLDQIIPRPTSHGGGLQRVLLSGDETEAAVCVDGRDLLCLEGDFLQVECGRSHSVMAKSEVEMLTVT